MPQRRPLNVESTDTSTLLPRSEVELRNASALEAELRLRASEQVKIRQCFEQKETRPAFGTPDASWSRHSLL
jgi:hypothetical protein